MFYIASWHPCLISYSRCEINKLSTRTNLYCNIIDICLYYNSDLSLYIMMSWHELCGYISGFRIQDSHPTEALPIDRHLLKIVCVSYGTRFEHHKNNPQERLP